MKIMKHKKIIETLKALAISSGGVKSSNHAAAVVRKGEIIAFGINQMKSHPFQKKYGRTNDCIYFHAETHSIFNSLKKVHVDDLKKCDLYVIRVLKNGTMSESCPCSGCKKAINWFNIRNVYYSDSKGTIQCL